MSFREVRPGDIEHVAAHLRESDRHEITSAQGHEDVLAILQQSVRASHLVWTCAAPDDEPIALLGVAPLNLLAGKGVPWMLATDRADKFPRIMLAGGRDMTALWLKTYPQLENYVHADNAKSVRWLKWLGYTIHDAKPFGAKGEPFHRFSIGCT